VPSFFLALLATALATVGGREALRVARLAAALRQSMALLAACWLAAAGGLALAVWIGAGVAGWLHPDAKAMLVALALLLAGLELLMLGAPPKPAEPTRSFGAIALVLAAGQLTGSGGLLVMALAAWSGIPALAGAGGMIGGAAVLTAAWAMADDWERLPLRSIRRTTAALLIAAGVAAALAARGLLG
jgi:hypothetical protein